MDDPFAPFMRAILGAPDDDLPRLVAADWLDEHGQPERAEFTRVQVKLEKPYNFCPFHPVIQRELYEQWLSHFGPKDVCQHYHELRRREQELLEATTINSFPNWMHWASRAANLRPSDHMSRRECYQFRRGFVASISCTAADFVAQAPAVFRCQPISFVTLSDKWPEEYPPGRFDFTRGRRGCNAHTYIPAAVCRFWPRSPGAAGWDYPSAEMAQADLSTACVRYGRCAALEPKVFRALTRPPGRRTRA